MKARVFLASLLAGAISMGARTSGEPLRPARADKAKKAKALEEKLESLQGLCQKMLALQKAVLDGTAALHKSIQASADKKPQPKDKKVALKLADKEKDIIGKATKAIDQISADGSAVAFAEVIEELRKDMKRVRRRLQSSDVNQDTQALEKEIIESLEDMIRALTKT
jgi:hypothetical protein